MSEASKLRELAALQKLRERRCESGVGAAQQRTRECQKATEAIADERADARQHLKVVMRSSALCLDRMLLATGQLNLAEDSLVCAQEELRKARDDEAKARDQWQQARFRSVDVARQARQATRREIRHREDAVLNDRLSLRAALEGGKP